MKTVLPSSSSARVLPRNQSAPVKSGSLLTWLFFAFSLVGGGLAWWEYGQNGELTKQLAEARLALEVATKPAPSVPAFVEVPMPARPDPQPTFPSPDDARQRGVAAIGALLNNPQIQQFASNMTQTIVTNAYAGLVQQLNLSPEQGAAFNDLVSQRALLGQEALRSATAQGLDLTANADQLRQQVSQAQAQVDQNIHNLLGDGGFQQYQDYSRNVQQQFRGGGLPAGN
ncbi:MAG: hypothetical protein WCL04_09295 [Verrucomicrobiota bacterium]